MMMQKKKIKIRVSCSRIELPLQILKNSEKEPLLISVLLLSFVKSQCLSLLLENILGLTSRRQQRLQRPFGCHLSKPTAATNDKIRLSTNGSGTGLHPLREVKSHRGQSSPWETGVQVSSNTEVKTQPRAGSKKPQCWVRN